MNSGGAAPLRVNISDEFARWLHTQADRGTVHVTDPDATAAVLLASLTYYPILNALIGHAPGDIEADRFAEAWIQHAAVTLRRRPRRSRKAGPLIHPVHGLR